MSQVTDLIQVSGKGVEGWIRGRRYRLGRPDWAIPAPVPSEIPTIDSAETYFWVALADDAGPLAFFGLEDALRAGVAESIEALRKQEIEVEMLSGDPSPLATRLAAKLGMQVAVSGASPEEKLGRVRFLQGEGERVAVVGDGVNDGPALRAGDVSVAMGTGADLTRLNSDAVLLRDDVRLLPIARDWADRTRRVIAQNLFWAAGYNLLALPLAVSGVLTPWMAALGMSASSLVVTLNAMRLRHVPVIP